MTSEMTYEQVREAFVNGVSFWIDYWLDEDKTPETKDKLEGLASSIMCMLDGHTVTFPAFIVAPLPSEADKKFSIELKNDWYPKNCSDNIKCNISGRLKDNLRYKRSCV